MRRAVLSSLLVLALAAPVFATEVLKLKNGEMVPGEVVSMDDQGVEFARQQGGKFRVRWSEVLPVSRYELWASTLEADDAAGRLELAGWALGEKLFHQARREAQKAQGVGDEEQQKAATKLLDEVARKEADAALAAIDERVADGDLDGALDQARRYLRVAPPGDHADRVRAKVPDLLVRIEQAEAAEAEQREQQETDRQRQKRLAWIETNLAKAIATKLKAQEVSIEAYAYLAKGNQTRSRRALAKSEKGFVSARDLLKKVRRAAGPGEVAEQCQREMEDADRRMVDLLTRWGQLEVGNKAWKKASPVVDRGLRIDPVDSALLELRREIDENWIRRRVSDITNAEPRESSR
jgi:hypothetical protein